MYDSPSIKVYDKSITNIRETLDKVNYYLHHEEESTKTEEKTSDLICKEHSYEVWCMELLKDREME